MSTGKGNHDRKSVNIKDNTHITTYRPITQNTPLVIDNGLGFKNIPRRIDTNRGRNFENSRDFGTQPNSGRSKIHSEIQVGTRNTGSTNLNVPREIRIGTSNFGSSNLNIPQEIQIGTNNFGSSNINIPREIKVGTGQERPNSRTGSQNFESPVLWTKSDQDVPVIWTPQQSEKSNANDFKEGVSAGAVLTIIDPSKRTKRQARARVSNARTTTISWLWGGPRYTSTTSSPFYNRDDTNIAQDYDLASQFDTADDRVLNPNERPWRPQSFGQAPQSSNFDRFQNDQRYRPNINSNPIDSQSQSDPLNNDHLSSVSHSNSQFGSENSFQEPSSSQSPVLEDRFNNYQSNDYVTLSGVTEKNFVNDKPWLQGDNSRYYSTLPTIESGTKISSGRATWVSGPPPGFKDFDDKPIQSKKQDRFGSDINNAPLRQSEPEFDFGNQPVQFSSGHSDDFYKPKMQLPVTQGKKIFSNAWDKHRHNSWNNFFNSLNTWWLVLYKLNQF